MMKNNSLKFVDIRKTKSVAGWHNKYIVHPYHELIVILSGIMHVAGADQKFELHPGDAALYPAGVKHWEQTDAEEPAENLFIVFEDATLSGDRILVNRRQGTLLRGMASALYEFSNEEESSSAFESDYLKLMLKIFSTVSPVSGQSSGLTCKINSFIRKNMANSLTLAVLANVAGLSKYHFLHQCRKESGKTPIQLLWEIRCSEAVSLLKYTDLPMKEIALRTGFSTMAHFSRRIKRFCGNTPGELRTGIYHRTAIPDNH